MKNYLFVIASYPDERQHFFEKYMSPRNKEYCLQNNTEYIEITSKPKLFRDNPTWWKFTFVKELIESGRVKENDTITHIDADMCIVDPKKPYPIKKNFNYVIDSGNTHCMGSYSIKVNEWSNQLIENILSEDRYRKLKDEVSYHEHFEKYSSFWKEFREQASWYSLAGIKRHSNISFFELPNYGWHSDKNEMTYYSLEDLHKNVQILPANWNVTELIGESSLEFNINKVDPQNVYIRHFSGGQSWRKDWFNIKGLKFKFFHTKLVSNNRYRFKEIFKKLANLKKRFWKNSI